MKIEKEKRMVSFMIALYCRKKEGNRELCAECAELEKYAHARLDRCKYGDQKTSCKRCPIHCYRPEMRERMRMVMRFSGPRMMWYAPVAALKHIIK